MATFVLVHGAWHGNWCWKKLAPLLEAAGHGVVAPDMPAHGRDTTPVAEVTLQSYADAICTAVNAQTESVILVGHSLGGAMITQAAETCPDNIRKLVYLTAFLLPNGVARQGYGVDVPGSLVPPNLVVAEDKATVAIRDEGFGPAFCHDCPDEDVEMARALTRPEPMAGIVTPVRHTPERFGRIPRAYIECTEDRALMPAVQRRMYSETPVDQVIQMATSHSPFFAAPNELASHLDTLAGDSIR
ncbi:MAG: alpha/beta fold hydrolase [Pseudomonadota bacterium]